ncbi:hypothetical protein, partial [Neisseria meningitidis]|uniref:hypothetical protein n=1 Tax=Neisseria meningitidis TaxID=487 RepID=UPI0028898D82
PTKPTTLTKPPATKSTPSTCRQPAATLHLPFAQNTQVLPESRRMAEKLRHSRAGGNLGLSAQKLIG